MGVEIEITLRDREVASVAFLPGHVIVRLRWQAVLRRALVVVYRDIGIDVTTFRFWRVAVIAGRAAPGQI